jgi:hypothetical protein
MEKSSEPFPLIPIVVTVVLICFIAVPWQLFIPTYPNWQVNSLSLIGCGIAFISTPFLVFLILSPFSKIKALRDKINAKTLTYLYIAALVTGMNVDYPRALSTHYNFAAVYVSDTAAKIMPRFMVPEREVVSLWINGGPILWDRWALPITWFCLNQILMAFFFIALASIFRRHWIDVEKVPFPQTMLAYELIREVTPEGRRRKTFLIGLLIGLAFQIPVALCQTFPWFPDIYGVRYRTCGHLTRWFGGDELLGQIAGMLPMNYNPLYVTVAYQAPMSVLFSSWFFALIYIIIVQVAYSLGYYSGITGIGTCGRDWCHPSPKTDPPLKFAAVTAGGLVAFGLMTLILQRQYIINTLKAAFGKTSTSPEKEEEPMSYRAAYITLIVSFLLTIVFFSASGLDLLDAFLMPLSALLLWYPLTRIYGLAGTTWKHSDKSLIIFRLVHPEPLPNPTQHWFVERLAGDEFDSPTWGWGGAAFSAFAGYRMASLTGASPKNALKTMIIATILSPIFSLVAFLLVVNAFTGPKLGQISSWHMGIPAGCCPNLTSGLWWKNTPASAPWEPWAAAGAAIIVVLSYLHARFVWFPLEPIGFFVGMSAMSTLHGQWMPFFVAWILKFLTLRIGGSKAYEEIGAPVSAGATTGCVIGATIGGALLVCRFFVPF